VTEEEGQEQADPLSGVMRRYETLVRPSLSTTNENTCRNDQHHLRHKEIHVCVEVAHCLG
jgi:hypothetical protein